MQIHFPLLTGSSGNDGYLTADGRYLGSKAVAYTTILDTLDGSQIPAPEGLMGTLAFVVDKRIPNADGEITIEQRLVVVAEQDLLLFTTDLWHPFIHTEQALPANADVVDLEFLDAAGESARLMVTDKGNNAVYIYTISGGSTMYEPDVGTDNDLPISVYRAYSFDSSVTITDDRMIAPLEILHVENRAFVTANNGTDERMDSVFGIDLTTNGVIGMLPVGLMPTGLSYDVDNDYLYVSGYISHTVFRWSLSEITSSE